MVWKLDTKPNVSISYAPDDDDAEESKLPDRETDDNDEALDSTDSREADAKEENQGDKTGWEETHVERQANYANEETNIWMITE